MGRGKDQKYYNNNRIRKSNYRKRSTRSVLNAIDNILCNDATKEIEPTLGSEQNGRNSSGDNKENVHHVAAANNENDTQSLPELEIATSPEVQSFKIGRRLVNVTYFINQLQSINHHDRVIGCDFNCFEVISEVRMGLDSKIMLKCSMCEKQFIVKLIEEQEDSMKVNHQLVSGVMSCGMSHNQLQTITSAIALPSISFNYYSSLHSQVCQWWETVATHSMAEAAKEEAEYAKSIGNVDKNGAPLVAVALDGCWSKRSYGKNYSALSGAAAILGLKFKKVLYLGVKNKFCIVCARSVTKNLTPPEHKCFMNYSGPSTAMESKIILEGFNSSVAEYGIIYHKFVADGDSSTYKKILESRPYGDLVVEKIECKNHLLRNFCNALDKLSKDTNYPTCVRKHVKDRYLRLRKGVNCAIKYWGEQSVTHEEKVNNLGKDILNGPQHVFGNHQNCHNYFCKPESRLPESPTIMSDLVASGLFFAIEGLCRKLSYHSRSLIYNSTSNIVESFNAHIAKYVGGKRLNFSQRGSYAGRCAASVVSFNTGMLHTSTHQVIFGTKPNYLITKMETTLLNRRRELPKSRLGRKRPHTTVLPDAHYGPTCEQPDMSPEVFEGAKELFLSNLKLSSTERESLERATAMQRNSAEWLSRRRNLLTSSNFGEVCKRRNTTSCASLVKKILYGSNISFIPAVRYGVENEETAIKQLEKQENISITNCGLFVDKIYEFLGTSPDGKYADGIVEVKCPSSLANMDIEEAMLKHSIFKLDKNSNSFILNQNHNWYYQIQGQLHITNYLICIFGIWFGADRPMKVFKIHRDDHFWETKMKEKLIAFYMDCLLPELVDPRICRSMEIRNPSYILQAMKEKKKRRISTLNDEIE